MPKQTDYVRTQVRLPPELYTAIKELADQEGLSLNEAMIQCLWAGLKSNGHMESSEEFAAEVAHRAIEETMLMFKLLTKEEVEAMGLKRRRLKVRGSLSETEKKHGE